jgi:L-methionine (R)-S-oxide reductase
MDKHQELLKEFDGLARSASGVKALMQRMSERLHEEMARYNWVGFYFIESPNRDALVLGPYEGSFMPTLSIPLNKGLCGAAATSKKSVVVNNVAADPRYLGSDMVKSNMVVPIIVKNQVEAELCIESYFTDTFDPSEKQFVESCAAVIARFMQKESTASAVGESQASH